jgi:D-alanyl-D-alanine carboxypeptidase (penicillin-binding protein 5/6)
VLAEKNQDDPRQQASMTKMMTAYIVLAKINKGELHWTDEAQIYLQENEKITLKNCSLV